MKYWLLLLFPLFADADMHLPSTATLVFGGDRQHTFNSGLDVNLSLQNNYQLFGGLESSRLPDADNGESMPTSGGNVGFGTDPLDTLSFDVMARAWRMADDLTAAGGEVGITWAADNFTARVTAGSETLKFRNLPRLLYPDRKSDVQDSFGTISYEHFIGDRWSLRFFYSKHKYSKDLNDYLRGINFIPQSVSTTVTSFSDQDGGIEVSGIWRKFTGRIELASSRSALDGVRTRRIQLAGYYKLSRRWTVGAMAGTSKPENSQVDPRDNRYGNASVSFSW